MTGTNRWVIKTERGFVMRKGDSGLVMTEEMKDALHFGEFEDAWEWIHLHKRECPDMKVEYVG